jgi:hypothetical protein
VNTARLADLEPRKRFESELEGVLRCRQAPNSLSFFFEPKADSDDGDEQYVGPPGMLDDLKVLILSFGLTKIVLSVTRRFRVRCGNRF